MFIEPRYLVQDCISVVYIYSWPLKNTGVIEFYDLSQLFTEVSDIPSSVTTVFSDWPVNYSKQMHKL